MIHKIQKGLLSGKKVPWCKKIAIEARFEPEKQIPVFKICSKHFLKLNSVIGSQRSFFGSCLRIYLNIVSVGTIKLHLIGLGYYF